MHINEKSLQCKIMSPTKRLLFHIKGFSDTIKVQMNSNRFSVYPVLFAQPLYSYPFYMLLPSYLYFSLQNYKLQAPIARLKFLPCFMTYFSFFIFYQSPGSYSHLYIYIYTTNTQKKIYNNKLPSCMLKIQFLFCNFPTMIIC